MAVFAGRLGFTLVPGARKTDYPRITGTVRGKHLEFFNYTTGAGKSRVHWVAVSVAPSVPARLTFRLSRQGLLSKVQEFFGASEITVGDPVFDGQWFIETNRPEFFRAALLPELRAKIEAARAVAPKQVRGEFRLEDGRVRYAEQGTFSEERCGRYEAMLPLLCDLADVAEVEASMG